MKRLALNTLLRSTSATRRAVTLIATATAAASLALILGALQVLAGGATIYTAQRRQANERARAADANLEAVRIDLAEKNRSGTATPADLERMREATDRVADTLSGKDKALGDSLREFVAHVTEISRPTARRGAGRRSSGRWRAGSCGWRSGARRREWELGWCRASWSCS